MKATPALRASTLILALASSIALVHCGGGGGGAAGPSNPLPGGGTTPTPIPSATPSAIPSPVVAVSPATLPTAPPTYAPLYTAVAADLSAFSSAVNAQCPNPTARTPVYVELLSANGNSLINTLPGQNAAYVTTAANNAVQAAVRLKQRFGITGVEFSVVYPLFVQNPANAPASYSTANYATFVSYYTQLVQGLRANGLGVAVETDLLFPTYVQNGSYSYSGVSAAQLENGVAEDAQNVINNLKPDRIILATEPSTIQYNTGIASINSPSGFASFVSAIRGQLSTASSPSTKIGAGSDDWQSSSFISSLVAGTSLDFYDLHIYPPDQLSSAISDMQALKATGKPVSISETWFNKESASTDGTSGPIDSQTVAVRDSYSFWGGMDAQFIASMTQLAGCESADYVMYWHSDLLYSYVDFNTTTANYSFSQMEQQLGLNQNAAIAGNYVSPAGYALMKATGLVP